MQMQQQDIDNSFRIVIVQIGDSSIPATTKDSQALCTKVEEMLRAGESVAALNENVSVTVYSIPCCPCSGERAIVFATVGDAACPANSQQTTSAKRFLEQVMSKRQDAILFTCVPVVLTLAPVRPTAQGFIGTAACGATEGDSQPCQS